MRPYFEDRDAKGSQTSGWRHKPYVYGYGYFLWEERKTRPLVHFVARFTQTFWPNKVLLDRLGFPDVIIKFRGRGGKWFSVRRISFTMRTTIFLENIFINICLLSFNSSFTSVSKFKLRFTPMTQWRLSRAFSFIRNNWGKRLHSLLTYPSVYPPTSFIHLNCMYSHIHTNTVEIPFGF